MTNSGSSPRQTTNLAAAAAERRYQQACACDHPSDPPAPRRPLQPIDEVHQFGTAPVIPPPPDVACTVQCPLCEAAPGVKCHSRPGRTCAPHDSRKRAGGEATRQAREAAARPKPQAAAAPAPPPAPPPPPDPRSDLDRAVEQLVRQHTCGSVIDAAWAASARLHPTLQHTRG